MGAPTLETFLEKKFGGKFDVRRTAVVVGNTPAQVIGSNFERLGLQFINTSANAVTIGFDNTVNGNNGFVLGANGGLLAFTADLDQVLPGFNYFAVGTVGGQTVQVIEIFRFAEAP